MACDRWHQRDVPTGLLNVLCVELVACDYISVRDITTPHLNQKWKMCGIYGVEETGKCFGKNVDPGVSGKLLPHSAPQLQAPPWLSEPQFFDL